MRQAKSGRWRDIIDLKWINLRKKKNNLYDSKINELEKRIKELEDKLYGKHD